MKLTRLIVAAVLMAGLGGVLWWSNKQEAAKQSAPPKEASPKILSLKEPDLRQVEIDHRDGEKTIVKRDSANQWQIVSPKPLPTDQGNVSSMTNAAASIVSNRVVDPNVTDLAAYGLAPPVLKLVITTADNKISTLLVGEDSPSGDVYAKVDGDPRLFTMGKFTKDSLDKTSKDLRDKRMLTFDSGKVSRIQLAVAKEPLIEFGRTGALQWQILKPKPLRADSSQVEDFLGRLHEAELDPKISDEDEKKYAAAFASAPVQATVTVTDPSGEQKLEVRKSKDDYYGKASTAEGVYKLTAADLTKFFDKKLDDFRAKKVFDFGFDDPTHVDVKDGAKTVSADKNGSNWTSGGKTMDSVSVDSLLDKLRDLSATKLIDSGSPSGMAIDVTVVSDQGKRTEKVHIYPSGKDFIAVREGDTTAYQLDASAVQALRTAAGDVKEQVPQAAKK